MMRKIAEYLSKFRNISAPQKLIETEAKKIIKELIGDKSRCDIHYNKPNLFITTYDSVLKNEIFINKTEITKTIKEKMNLSVLLDIRFK